MWDVAVWLGTIAVEYSVVCLGLVVFAVIALALDEWVTRRWRERNGRDDDAP